MIIQKLTLWEKIKISFIYLCVIVVTVGLAVFFINTGMILFNEFFVLPKSINPLKIIYGVMTTLACIVVVCVLLAVLILAMNHVIKAWDGELVRMITTDGDSYIVYKKDITYEK